MLSFSSLLSFGGKILAPVRLPLNGPLHVNPLNPRYFTNGSGRAIFLTGSHTWANLIDLGRSDPPRRFDYSAYLDFLTRHNHNFFRLWAWEHSYWPGESLLNNPADLWLDPLPYARTGPGRTLDGKPKCDLTKFNSDYFDRLRDRVLRAGQMGIYVSIMLFNGFSIERKDGKSDPWRAHPFNAANNINGIDGDRNGHGEGREVHTLSDPAITALQEAYVRRVVDTVNDLDNVLFEISNESRPESRDWQHHVIRYLKQNESGRPRQHPVGMTVAWPGGDNADLWDSPADWISPNGNLEPLIPADGRKVVIEDTDHLCGICGSVSWVWKSFLSGRNPIFMDPYDIFKEFTTVPPIDIRISTWEPVRRNMGYTLTYANQMNLAAMIPQGGLASSGYCLADQRPGQAAYLTYFPDGTGTLNLPATGNYEAQWFRPANGKVYSCKTAIHGRRQYAAPFQGEAVLYLHEGVH
jgi:hypothetical protein